MSKNFIWPPAAAAAPTGPTGPRNPVTRRAFAA